MEPNNHNKGKKAAAEKATEWVKDGMIVGLGTGSTAYYAIQRLGTMVNEGLRIKAVASSLVSEQLARELEIHLIPLSQIDHIDLTIDGADEVDEAHNLIKGGGGALLREKILAYHSKELIIVVEEKKLVHTLGRFPLPVEVVPFAADLTVKHLADLGGTAALRQQDGTLYRTDNGNYIADCRFGEIPDPASLDIIIRTIPGVVETGLFLHHMVSRVVVGYEDGSVKY
jgi:ribose 5-phosphate isomerase A